MALQQFAWGSLVQISASYWNKISYYFQIQVDIENIEPRQIIQACGYVAITLILQLGATLLVVMNSHLRNLSQMETIQSVQNLQLLKICVWVLLCLETRWILFALDRTWIVKFYEGGIVYF